MTISLAFLAPDLVKAAIEGRSPTAWASRGYSTSRRMVTPAPRARPRRLIDVLSNQSPQPVSVSGKRDSEARDKACRKRPASFGRLQRLNAPKRRQHGAIFAAFEEISGFDRNAWWAREDSNLQPDRYERASGLPKPKAKLFQRAITPDLKSASVIFDQYQCGPVKQIQSASFV